ncbi:MAG: rubrerythrin family protein [Nitrososphaerota archaeon]
MKEAQAYCQEEYVDYSLYSALATRERQSERSKVLRDMAEMERRHYSFWSRYAGGYEPHLSRWQLIGVLLLRRLFGLVFTMKFLERHERRVIESYRRFAQALEGQEREELEGIIREEEEHERYFMSQVDEGAVRYLSFVILGLADAIVEITGVHAGFLGVTSSTLIAGIAGLIVGFSAAVAMASAAYLQARQQKGISPQSSAGATGISYLGAAVAMALPYFLTHDMLLAFSASVTVAIALVAFFTFYGNVLADRPFAREFLISVGLTLGTAFGSFLFGDVLGTAFGLRGIIPS